MSPETNVEGVIEILSDVRRRGHPVSLSIFGHSQDPSYERRVRAAAGERGEWVSVALDLPRSSLLHRMARCRFGIHGMVGEHFGIAVAEMVRLGCVCFAPYDGGPAEILGGDERLLYRSPGDAVAKICAALEDPGRLASLRAQIDSRAKHFSSETFVREFGQVCESVLGARSGAMAGFTADNGPRT